MNSGKYQPRKPPVAAPPPAVPRGRRRNEGYRYYLEDHPILGPVLTLVLGGLCLYGTIFTNTLQRFLAGPNADGSALSNVNTVLSWGVAFVIGIMGLTLVYLLWHLGEVGLRRARRRPLVCPRCGTVEVPAMLRFAHQPVSGTSWETVTCPQCGNEWHNRL